MSKETNKCQKRDERRERDESILDKNREREQSWREKRKNELGSF